MREGSGRRIFGPVPSRRLGLSLGIDVIPSKTCSFDCVYCECGATTEKTCERREFFPVAEILAELEERLAESPERPDAITLSGSGEPTLYRPLGTLIDGIKRLSSSPVAVITNSSLLWMDEVREAVGRADVVLPSLDAATEGAFARINRPHELCTLPRVMDGLARFLDGYRGTVLFEILLLEGYNTDRENLEALRAALGRMRAGRVQLNTAVRPGTERHIEPLDEASMERIRAFFGPSAEVIAAAGTTRTRHEAGILEERAVSLLGRRPCTAGDVAAALGIAPSDATLLLERLKAAGKAIDREHGGSTFWSAGSGPRK